jgi:hypothetical protein
MKKAFIGAVMLVCAGCGVEANAPVESEGSAVPVETSSAEKGLLARLQRDNGNVVEFYEFQPGDVVITEAGRPPNPPAQIQGLDPVEAYRALAGKQDVPSSLVAAQQRMELARASAPAVPLQAQGPVPEMTTQTQTPGGVLAAAAGPCDAAWFTQNFCFSGYSWSMCLTNWWGGAWAQINGADYHYSAVCPFYGSVVMNIQNQGIWAVPQGTYRWAWRSGSNYTYRMDITNALNSGFQVAANVNY